jgi:hypothetical protein
MKAESAQNYCSVARISVSVFPGAAASLVEM